MKNSTLIVLFCFAFANCLFAQKNKTLPKKILIEKFAALLSPYNGRVYETNLSYSSNLYLKYGIKAIEFYKINKLDGSDCNFTYFEAVDVMPQSLNIGDFYIGSVYDKAKTISVEIKYNKYIENKKYPIASQVEMIYYVYKF